MRMENPLCMLLDRLFFGTFSISLRIAWAWRQAIASGDADIAPRAVYNLGLLLADQGDVEEAKAAYRQAIASGDADMAPTAAVNLGVLLAKQGDVEGAKAAYQQAIDSSHAEAASKAVGNLERLLRSIPPPAAS
jgi:tetratricopeptide (TPR) repeat protein